ncbi:MAG: hypothetical protein J5807_05130 [Kiritimatiellae bacterium]|nr:hypothetical protein [Kiritimatiellia bacterium]
MKIKYASVICVLATVTATDCFARGIHLLDCDRKGCPLPLVVPGMQWIYSATETNMTSNVLPSGCLEGAVDFCCFGLEFKSFVASNRLSVAAHDSIERRKACGGNVQVAGLVEHRLEISKNGEWVATAYLYEEVSTKHAREIAIRDFFRASSMQTDAIAESIDLRVGNVGDFSFSWKPYDNNADYVTFVSGRLAVIVSGVKCAVSVAKVVERLIKECERACKKGETISLSTAAMRLSNSNKDGNEKSVNAGR